MRALIATLWLGETKDKLPPRTFGRVTLAEHQQMGLRQARAAIEEFGGALLCDAVGLGKTYVAIAAAGPARKILIVAPAALRDMWIAAADRCSADVRFVSVESLSRAEPARIADTDFLIIDEAHHFRNPATRRYQRLAKLASRLKIILLTATPIHNRASDLVTIASLFLGSRAQCLTAAELGRLIIRREREQIRTRLKMPAAATAVWLSVSDRPGIPALIVALPPPVPFNGDGEASSLVNAGLVRQWASSEAALTAALRRRLVRAGALESSLEAGRHPSRAQLRSWMVGDQTLQLGFSDLLLAPSTSSTADLLSVIRAHSSALRNLLAIVSCGGGIDDERAGNLRRIREIHSTGLVVGFATYAATVDMLFRKLMKDGRVAALTSAGGRVAGGSVTREEVLRQFSPRPRAVPEAERITLLLTTDVLSEGVNMQNANVAVHLDLPWTPARVEQRVGRMARIGSRHRNVHIYGISPPASADAALGLKAVLARKSEMIAANFSPTMPLGFELRDPMSSHAAPRLTEQLRVILRQWLGSAMKTAVSSPLVGAVPAPRKGFLALALVEGRARLLCGDEKTISEEIPDLLGASGQATGADVLFDETEGALALARLNEWLEAQRAARACGLGPVGPLARRRELLARIDGIIARTPPHTRPRHGALLKAARRIAAIGHPAGIERELDDLLREESIDEAAWLARLVRIGQARRAQNASAEKAESSIQALLLLIPPPSS